MDWAQMAAKIFLAHAREDKPQVRKLYADLQKQGFDPWLDEKDLRAGQIWKIEIPKAIHAARLFLVCLSSRSVGKTGYVQIELREALAAFGERPPGSIYVVPVRLDECEVPDLQIPNLGLSLQDIHWVDLWQDGGFERLVSDLQHALGGATLLQASREETPTPIPPLMQEAEPRAKQTREQAKPVEATALGGELKDTNTPKDHLLIRPIINQLLSAASLSGYCGTIFVLQSIIGSVVLSVLLTCLVGLMSTWMWCIFGDIRKYGWMLQTNGELAQEICGLLVAFSIIGAYSPLLFYQVIILSTCYIAVSLVVALVFRREWARQTGASPARTSA